jgi:SAM-dependent methyltransferase
MPFSLRQLLPFGSHAVETVFDLEGIDVGRLREFREVLVERGYRSDVICARTRELPSGFRPGTVQEAIYEYLFHEQPALLTLIKLFLSDRAFARREVLTVLPEGVVQFLLGIGLLEQVKDQYRAPFLVFPVRGRYIVTDHFGDIHSLAERQRVFQLGKEQNILANGLLPGPCGAALDLCTGSGMFAILAAEHAEHVWSVDVNPRAVNFTRFNALLNDVRNLECVEGDLYEPLHGLTFDRILANPPYNPAVGPKDAARLSVHGGLGGEELLFRVIAGLDRHLRPNGSAQIISRFFYGATGSYAERLKPILDLGRFNMLLLQTQPREIFTFSNLFKTSWSVGREGLAELGAYYRAHDIERESFGILNIRHAAAGGVFRDDVMDFDSFLDRDFGRSIDERLAGAN